MPRRALDCELRTKIEAKDNDIIVESLNKTLK